MRKQCFLFRSCLNSPTTTSPVQIYCFTGFHKYLYVDAMVWLFYQGFKDLFCHHLPRNLSTPVNLTFTSVLQPPSGYSAIANRKGNKMTDIRRADLFICGGLTWQPHSLCCRLTAINLQITLLVYVF
jgi:hypothetical protein